MAEGSAKQLRCFVGYRASAESLIERPVSPTVCAHSLGCEFRSVRLHVVEVNIDFTCHGGLHVRLTLHPDLHSNLFGALQQVQWQAGGDAPRKGSAHKLVHLPVGWGRSTGFSLHSLVHC